MKRIFTLFGIFTLVSQVTFAQFSIVSQKKIGGSGNDYLGLSYTHDSTGYYLIGNSDSNASFDKSENSRGGTDLWIVKTDLNFNILWDKTIGGDQYETVLRSIISDTAIYCLLSTSSNGTGEMSVPNYGGSDFWLLKLDLNGNILMQKCFGGTGNEEVGTLMIKNNHFLLAGKSDSPISGNKTIDSIGGKDLWILEIDPTDFSILTEKVIGSPQDDDFMNMIQLNNGNYYFLASSNQGVGGDKTDFGYGSSDFWIVKTDSNLNILADKCFGGIYNEDLGGIRTNGLDIFLSGPSNSIPSGNKTAPFQGSIDAFYYSDVWVVKLDSNLNIVWDKTYGGTYIDEGGGISFLSNNNISINTVSSSPMNSGNKTSQLYGGRDAWFVFINSNGDITSQFSLGGNKNDWLGIYQQKNDTLLCSGTTSSPISGNQTTGTYSLNKADFWAVTIKTTNLSVPTIADQEISLNAYPNPFEDEITFQFEQILEQNQKICIYTTDGKLIEELTAPQGTTNLTWNPNCGGGIYYYEAGNAKGKLIYLK